MAGNQKLGPNIKKEEIITESLIAKGEYGSVWKGKCRGLTVAIKNPIQKLTSRNLIAFRREVEIMSEIYHPNVCLFLGASTESGEISIVSEMMSGSLTSLIKSPQNYPLSKRLDWALQAARGVSWLHQNNPPVIHMDLKPDNILYDDELRIKVCDFGLSKFKEGAKAIINQPTGTPLYMAPEIMEVRANQPKQVTEKADVYSFSIILWEILTKQEAYAGFTNYILFSKAVRSGERPPIPSDCPPKLAALLEICWHLQPNERPLFPQIVNELEIIVNECEIAEKKENVNSKIHDENAQIFWTENFINKEKVEWNEFVNAFYKYLQLEVPTDVNPEDLNDESRLFLCLKSVLIGNSKSDIVDISIFGKVIGWFGPLEVPHRDGGFLDRIKELLSQSYFHGYISSGEAAGFLNSSDKEPGTYLVRFSQNFDNSFCLTKIATDKSIRNVVIQRRPEGGFQVEEGGKVYPSLPELIEKEANKRRFLIPVYSDTYSWLFSTNQVSASPYSYDNDDDY